MAPLITKIALLILAAAAFWTLWGFPYTNGLLSMLGDLPKPGAYLPGPTQIPMKQRYTGIKVVDDRLTVLVGFFYTAIDGNRVDVSLHGLDLGGQVVAAWILMVVEGMRMGNRGKWYITSVTILGFLMQLIGFACIAPLWMALQLWTSPTAAGRDVNDLMVSPLQVAIAPVSVMIGYGIPSVMMCLAAPSVINFEQKQNWAAIQQAWPFWIAITQVVLSILVAVINPMVSVMTEDDKKTRALKYLRRAYGFGLVSSTAGHLTAWFLSLLAYTFPVLFSAKYLPMMQPSVVFGYIWPFPPAQAQTLAEGALWFLQWDLLIGAIAVLLWALTLWISAKRQEGSFYQWVIGFIKAGVLSVAVGPCGAAVIAVWARDELVFRRAAEEKASKRKNN